MKTIPNKGFKMALPFVAGVALGALAIVAFNKRDKIARCAKEGFEKGKEFANNGLEKGKEIINQSRKEINKLSNEDTTKTDTKSQVKHKRAPRKQITQTQQNLASE